MANPTITTQIANADPNASPLTINEFIDLLNTLIGSELTGSYIPYIIQKSTPGVEDRDKAWIELDSAGRPIATKIWYAGPTAAWRRIYNGMIGEVRVYFGNPGYSTNINDDFDPDGKGHIGGRYDGWQICNGKNGSPNFSNRELCGADMSGSAKGFTDGHWRTLIDGQTYDTGGQWTEPLDATEVPLPATPPIIVGKWSADGNSRPTDGTGDLYGLPKLAGGQPDPNSIENKILFVATAGNQSPVPVFTGDPFASVAFMIFQGY